MSGGGERTIPGEGGKTEIARRVTLAAKVFDTYGKEIRAIITSLVRDREVADDIYQDFFLSLIREPVPPYVRGYRGTVAYLYRVLSNDIVDNHRRSTNRQDHMERYAECRKRSIADKDTLDVIVDVEEAERMLRILEGHLAKREAKAVTLRYSHGLSTAETARRMNVDVQSIYRYCCVGLKKIRRIVSKLQTISENL
ncbi:MAG: RNA polymerase sigma factor [Planctomycetota bacterium]|jgi:RNA polymerase sigma factor (sigma-70 family)